MDFLTKLTELEKNGNKYEKDSSPIAWKMYLKEYVKNGTFDDFYIQGKRIIFKCVISGILFDIAGDCSFNFNNKKVNIFKKILNEDQSISTNKKSELQKKLEKCSENHHSLQNFDLMPVTGGLNNVKGNLKYKEDCILVHGVGRKPENDLLDRLDTYLYFLKNSLQNRNELVKNKSVDLKLIGEYLSNSVYKKSLNSENFVSLYEILEKFDDIYKYCEVFYNLRDKSFIDKIIANGKNPITNAMELEKYIDLAMLFWKKRKNRINRS